MYRKNPRTQKSGVQKSGTPAPDILGTVQAHRDGHAFVLREDGGGPDIFLPPQTMRGVLHQDCVWVQIVGSDRRGRPIGQVSEIVARRLRTVIARLHKEGTTWLAVPEDRRHGSGIFLSQKPAARPGQVVQVQLDETPSLDGPLSGHVLEVLGDVGDPGMEVEIAVRKFALPHAFSEDCLAQAQSMPDKVRPAECKGRVDLRDLPFVTIDGEDARDFDDAVYCEPAKIGRAKAWRLLVAIADVSHYVKSGSALDEDAWQRATSVYFPRRVIPMLPENLSNGLCSLNPHADRLCLVCDMVLDADGGIHAYQFYPAVMHSHARLTYVQVAAILARPQGDEARARSDLLPHLQHLHAAYQALLAARKMRGAADFATVETQIVCDDHGRIEAIRPAERTEAHRLIEEAMLAANVCGADFVQQNGHPALFRVHDQPAPDKIATLRNYLRAMGIQAKLDDALETAQLQSIAEATRQRPDALQIHTMLLRSMKQAAYTPEQRGHFGLALDAYAHFTSPIRRYPDLLLHRAIKAILQDKTWRMPLRAGGKTPATARASAAERQLRAWEQAGAHCSACERRADEASRDVQAWLKCQYMQQFVGEAFDGTVSAVTGFGLFITLDAVHVDGLLHITELGGRGGGEYLQFDEARQELRGSGRTAWRLGSRVRVQLVRVDVDSRHIDLRLAAADGTAEKTSGKTPGKAAKKSARRKAHKTGPGKAA